MPPFATDAMSRNGLSNGAGRRASNGGASVNLAIDNMIRNQLKVGDVRDPKQIADALLNYYKDTPAAAGMREEAAGLPLLQAPSQAMAMPARPTSSDAELNIAKNDVEKALADLTTNPLTVDIVPEMQGWADSIRTAVEAGAAAARNGLDPSQRDKVIALRRQLGEYARMARFAGALAPGITPNYRRLAQGLDEVAAVMLVMLGESLASVGFAYGYYLLQIPFGELQQRRDAAIFALRNFIGATQEAYGPDEWPRGINAYRLLYNWLERQGQGDLRTLLIENELAQIMDTLIARAQNGTPEGLRALGVTAQLDLERFRRMAIVAPGAMPGFNGGAGSGLPDVSPPLVSFLEALLLFADAFQPAGGLRLLRIARPAILFYGLYNPNLLEQDTALLGMIMTRGNLATLLDSLFPAAGAGSVIPQVLLDMAVTSLDRAIDLLSLGAEPGIDRQTETRALAYWFIILAIIVVLENDYSLPISSPGHKSLTYPTPLQDPNFQELIIEAIGDLMLNDVRMRQLTNQQAQLGKELDKLKGRDPSLIRVIDKLAWDAAEVIGTAGWGDKSREQRHRIEMVRRIIEEELRVQRSLDRRWRNLIRTVGPEAGNQATVFDWPLVVVSLAIRFAALPSMPRSDEPLELRALPPQYEETLLTIAGRMK